tara:strand:- start:342 stop:542 length:201 start_codon:yes stop_codon:yes gene_type:complete
MTEEEIAALEAKKVEEITWRDRELKNTDWVVMVDDHPERPLYYDYRARLRDWTDSGDFPDTRPTLL